jgi:phosphoglycerate-specific signal transduction histidine kinase
MFRGADEGSEFTGLQSGGKRLPERALETGHQDPLNSVLRDSQKLIAIGRLMGSIAHEINNPLESM